MMTEHKWASRLLRFGLALVLLYAGVSSLLDPSSWIGFIPPWMSSIIDPATFLLIFSVFEVVLALWLLSGWGAFFSGIITGLLMFSIVASNIKMLEILFRDIAIGLAALTLAVLHAPEPTVDHHARS